MKKQQGLFFKICIWQVLYQFSAFGLLQRVANLSKEIMVFSCWLLMRNILMQLQLQIMHLLHFFLAGHAKAALGMHACLLVQLVAVLPKY